MNESARKNGETRAPKGERGIRSKRRRWRGAILPLLLLLAGSLFLLGGCGGGDERQTLSTVRGLVSTFDGYAAGGEAALLDASGSPLPGASAEVNERGLFVISPPDPLPARFTARITEIRPREGIVSLSLPAPLELRVLVEGADGEHVTVRATPLTSLVARYAERTGKALAESDAAVATLLGLQPGIPSRLIPLAEGGESFCFKVFGAEWAESGTSFDAFLDGLVDDALTGRTRSFEGDALFEDIIFKWVLKNVVSGASSKVGGEGVGWLMKLISGPDPMDEIKDKLNEMSGKLDKITNQINQLHGDMEKLLKILETQIAYSRMKGGIVSIETLYGERLPALSRITVKEDARREASKIEWEISNKIFDALASIHKELRESDLAKSFYFLLAEQLLLQTESGDTTPEGALAKYAHVYAYMTGVQLKGLVLASEYWHQSLSAEGDIEREVMNEHKKYIERLEEQSVRFLDGAELLLVHAAPQAGFTMEYYGGAPATGEQTPFFQVDALAAAAVDAESQVVVRLLWDSKVREQYPWSDRAPQDYADYFAFMRERLEAIEKEGASGPLLLLRSESGSVVEAVGKYGSVNAMSRRRLGRTPEKTRAVVRRYVFRNLKDVGRPYTLVASPETSRRFDLRGGEVIPVPGTVGRGLVAESPAIRTRVGPLIGTNIPLYTTLPLFAWLPEAYVLRNGAADPAGGEPIARLFEYAVKNDFRDRESYLARVLDFLDDRPTYPARAVSPKEGHRHEFTRHTLRGGGAPLSYRGGAFSLKVEGVDDDAEKNALSAFGTQMKYAVDDPALLTLEPLPSIAAMFVDPRTSAEPVWPREGVPLLLKTNAGFMRIEDYGEYVRSDGEVKCREQRWTFERF